MTANLKISAISTRRHSHETSVPGTTNETPANSDQYVDSGANDYKTLVSGNPKARETSPIQEMFGVIEAGRPQAKRDPYQVLLEEMLYGDAGPQAKPSDFEDIYIPSFKDIRKRSSGLANTSDGAQGILDRFLGLEETLNILLTEMDKSLNSSNASTKFREDELAAMRDRKSELQQQLGFCRKQIREAENNLKLAKESEKAALEKLKEDNEWWNPEDEV